VVCVYVLEHAEQEAAQPATGELVARSVVLDVPEHRIAATVQHAANVPGLVVVVEDRGIATLDPFAAHPTVPGLLRHHLGTVRRYLRGFELVHRLP